MFITNIGQSSNFLNALSAIEAGSELTEEKWNTVSFSIISSCRYSFFVPFSAIISFLKRRFSRSTHISTKLAAIAVIIKNMLCWIILGTWWSSESEINNYTTKDSNGVWELSWFKEHYLWIISWLISLLVSSCIKRFKTNSIKFSWFINQRGVS